MTRQQSDDIAHGSQTDAFYKPSMGIGHMSAHRDWGTIAKCPHCAKTDIKRLAKQQITCGGFRCREKQNHLTPEQKRALRLCQVDTGEK